MSGSLGVLVADLGSMVVRPAPLILGSLVLDGHEVPARITIGGRQAVTIHKMPGGARIIDAMGADEGALSWRGLFVGPAAAQRARLVDQMRQQGSPQVLSFGDYTFNIVIVHYEYDYQDRGAVITYRLRGEVVPDLAGGSRSGGDLGFTLQGDLSMAQAVLQGGFATASPYVPLAVGTSGPGMAGTIASLATIATSVGATATLTGSSGPVTSGISASIQGELESSAASLLAGVNAVSGNCFAAHGADLSFVSPASLLDATTQAIVLATLIRAGGYINRTNANLASANAQVLAPLIHA